MDLTCSARGCTAPAEWGVRWNNPKIHTPERRKVWLACSAHREHLEHFLARRDFLRDTVPVEELSDDQGPEGRPSDGRAPAAEPAPEP